MLKQLRQTEGLRVLERGYKERIISNVASGEGTADVSTTQGTRRR